MKLLCRFSIFKARTVRNLNFPGFYMQLYATHLPQFLAQNTFYTFFYDLFNIFGHLLKKIYKSLFVEKFLLYFNVKKCQKVHALLLVEPIDKKTSLEFLKKKNMKTRLELFVSASWKFENILQIVCFWSFRKNLLLTYAKCPSAWHDDENLRLHRVKLPVISRTQIQFRSSSRKRARAEWFFLSCLCSIVMLLALRSLGA